MEKCKFADVEIIDGYFSGVAFIYEINKRYIVNISYDIEFEKIDLKNCTNIYYNSNLEEYDEDELEELKNQNYPLLKKEIQDFINKNGTLVFSTN